MKPRQGTARRRGPRGLAAAIGALILCLSLGACRAPGQQLGRPVFAVPRGVFITPVPLVYDGEEGLLPSLSAAGPWLAYTGSQAGNLDIYLRPYSGGPARRLTEHSTDDSDPALSPDGRQLAWISQVDDVKGDVWVMDLDGGHRRRLSDRRTTDAAPTWSGDGRRIYYTARAGSQAAPRIDCVDLDTVAASRTLVASGWDAAASPDDAMLLYVAPAAPTTTRPAPTTRSTPPSGPTVQPQIWGRQATDGRVLPLLPTLELQAAPHVGRHADNSLMAVFSRFIDDSNGDGRLDAADAPSLWACHLAPTPWATLQTSLCLGAPWPLTAGQGGEIFASVQGDWLAYTAQRGGSLAIMALPLTGMVAATARPTAVLAAGRADDDPSLRRLALRHILATNPELAPLARYELARYLGEEGRWQEAIDELDGLLTSLGPPLPAPLGPVAQLERERQRLLLRLRGSLHRRERDADTDAFIAALATRVATIAAAAPGVAAVQERAALIAAEVDIAQRHRNEAVRRLEALLASDTVIDENGSRAARYLGTIYGALGDLEAVARVSAAALRRFPQERATAVRLAERWVALADASAEPLGALQALLRDHAELPPVAARAAAALARRQAALGEQEAALATWQNLLSAYGDERPLVALALRQVAQLAAERGDEHTALATYERLARDFADNTELRQEARRGLTAVALTAGTAAEARGERGRARDIYVRLLAANPDLVVAQRRSIALTAGLGQLPALLTDYAQRAAATPSDRTAAYGHALALTYTSPPQLEKAEAVLQALLVRDPRFAAAHQTLGWVHLQREAATPERGHLELAAEALQTAQGLVDVGEAPELWAAASLNLGHALFGLGKLDDAFVAYLGRAQLDLPFDSPAAELLFREYFSRTAQRLGALDLALDQTGLALRLSADLPQQPHRPALLALQAAAHLLAHNAAQARVSYRQAGAAYEALGQYQHLLVMLRGEALAAEALGDDATALARFARVLELLAAGHAPPPPPRGLLVTEIVADPTNVTAAVYGFEALQEAAIADASAARIRRRRRDPLAALPLLQRRLEHLEALQEDERQRPRLLPERRRAHYEMAQAQAAAGHAAAASRQLRAALALARPGSEVEATALFDAGLQLLLEAPRTADLDWSTMAAAAEAGETALTAPDDGERSSAAAAASDADSSADGAPDPDRATRRRSLLLLQTGAALAPPQAVDGAASERLEARLRQLDGATGAARRALALARQQPTRALTEHLRQLGFAGPLPADGATANPLAAASAVSAVSAVSAIDTTPTSWQDALDRSLASAAADAAAQALQQADVLFRRATAPSAPALTAQLLAQLAATPKELRPTAAWWSLLEHARLLQLQPDPERLAATPWGAARAALGEPTAADFVQRLQAAPPMLQALLGHPAELPAVQASLGPDAALVQLFAPRHGQWDWFLIDARGLLHGTGPAGASAPAPALQAALAARPPAHIYLDAGELLGPSAAAWLQAGSVSQVLSATYLVAATAAPAPARRGFYHLTATTVAPAASLQRAGSSRQLLILDMEGRRTSGPQALLGAVQVAFAGPDTPLTLDALAGLRLQAEVALVPRLEAAPRAAAATAQALLLAGVPSAVLGWAEPAASAAAGASLMRILTRLAPIAEATPQLPPGLALWGLRGQTPAARVVAAQALLSRDIGRAGDAIRRGQAAQARSNWEAARAALEDLDATLAFLAQPAAQAALLASPLPSLQRTLKSLPAARVSTLQRLSEMHAKLDDQPGGLRTGEALLAVQAARGDTLGLLRTHAHLAAIQRSLQAYDRATAHSQQCIDLAQAAGHQAYEVDCYQQLGLAHAEGRAVAAAIAAFRGGLATALRAGLPTGALYQELGHLEEQRLNNYVAAEALYRSGLAASPAATAAPMRFSLLLDLGRLKRTVGAYAEALEVVDTAAQLLTDDATASARAAVALERAKIGWYRGDYPGALAFQEEALRLARSAGSLREELQAHSLAGLIALNQGDLKRAEAALRLALELARASGDRGEEATQLGNLGTVLREAGRLEAAIDLFRAALALDEAQNSSEGRAYDLRNLGLALLRQGAVAAAGEANGTALGLSRSLGDRYNEVQCLLSQAEIAIAAGSPAAAAAAHYRAAAELATQLALPEILWRAEYGLGRLARAATEPRLARVHYDRALQVAEGLGRSQQAPGQELGRSDLYADALTLALAEGDLEGAYLYGERDQAGRLDDLIRSQPVALPSPAAAALLQRLGAGHEAAILAGRQLQAAQARADARRVAADRANPTAQAGQNTSNLAPPADGDPSAVAGHTAALLGDLRAQLQRQFPRLARAFAGAPVPLASLQALLPADMRVVAFHVGRRETTALVLGHDSLTGHVLPLAAVELERATGVLEGDLRALAPVDAQLEQLGAALLAPLWPELRAAQRLVILADGPLHRLPLGALTVAGAPLWQHLALSQVPSLAVLADLLASAPMGHVPPRRVVALAPTADLPFAHLEAQAVTEGHAWLGSAARREALLDLDTDALDLATHLTLDGADPLSSGLLLSDGAGGSRRLALRELLALRLPPLVTLSACETLRAPSPGAEWLALGHLSLAAGARTVVTTQRQISDLVAALGMKHFYRQLRQQPPAAALRAAVLSLRRDYPHPAHWANFVLVGL